ncbi:MAG: glycosyltransferase family 2 protein [Roseinatronobacter sp.]|nr:glycosyltransferase family 2 protein [Roseinatronobacter sp.]
MSGDQRAPVAAITMVRGDPEFLKIWIRHYGRQFGEENLFVLQDGQDQPRPESRANIVALPHVAASRTRGDYARSRAVSAFARGLFFHYQRVIACDVDELLCLDPAAGPSLAEYLLNNVRAPSVSAIGLDIGQNCNSETALDFERPILEQRQFARVSARYTKPVVATRPLTWGAGFHRVKGGALNIDSNLVLFHLGLLDFARAAAKAERAELVESGWKGHFDRRLELFGAIAAHPARDFDLELPTARRKMLWRRPLYALNKPGTVSSDIIVKIPDRFRKIF